MLAVLFQPLCVKELLWMALQKYASDLIFKSILKNDILWFRSILFWSGQVVIVPFMSVSNQNIHCTDHVTIYQGDKNQLDAIWG